ncbi:GGDEF domain-containing protein [Modestobacter marinus]|nr:GGDEF domain-containing protein [Modestobacter marinus]NIH70206.1 diguanylate cyclase (GGDEF)-like protein [Modestobacter marinus]
MAGAHMPDARRGRESTRPARDPLRPGRAPENALAAWALAALLGVGAVLGSINLFVDGAVRQGASRPLHAVTLAACLAIAGWLVVRRRAGEAATVALVLFGDLVYVVFAWASGDPLRYAPPLMLLFTCFVAAWFLGVRALAVHMVAVVVACWLALADSYPGTAALLVAVVASAGMLDVATVGVFVLRRRVQRLLTATQALSSTDPLTGLANRRSLVDQAPRIWRQARRDGQRVAALVLDLDHFKRLNDTYGHAVGDAVLREVSRALAASVRPADVLARTGGEELVVLGLVSDPDEAWRLAQRLRLAVVDSSCGQQHAVTASIGVALAGPVDGEDPTDALWQLVDRADAAMYEAKEGGRDRVVVAGSLIVPRSRVAGGARRGQRGGGIA